jgi:uncharacterized membrane protein (DUF485 family)
MEHPHDDHPELTAANASSGLWLFALYCLAYGVFMYLAAFRPNTLAMVTPLGPNLAIVYGFGLILGALVIALLYMLLCQGNTRRIYSSTPPLHKK